MADQPGASTQSGRVERIRAKIENGSSTVNSQVGKGNSTKEVPTRPHDVIAETMANILTGALQRNPWNGRSDYANH